jgi:hypothetical protein
MLLLLQALPPVRSKIKRTSKDQKSKHDKQNERPVRISWDKFDVVSFTLLIVINSFLANGAGSMGNTNDAIMLIFCFVKGLKQTL